LLRMPSAQFSPDGNTVDSSRIELVPCPPRLTRDRDGDRW
jgi:hypothetical protein